MNHYNRFILKKGYSFTSSMLTVGQHIDANMEVFEISPCGEEIFLGFVTRKIMVYICLYFIDLAISRIKDLKPKDLGPKCLGLVDPQVILFAKVARQWLNGNIENIDFNEFDFDKQCLYEYESFNLMAEDCIFIIKEQTDGYLCDMYYQELFFEGKEDSENEHLRQSLFIIDFLKSPESLFYI